ncbi:MAG TPA: histidine--tRNA ligase [Candidatus Saccharimonadales bacterium]|nr:histidine--tRNA ligase [Candidatus Saccharimonadales bacterium]
MEKELLQPMSGFRDYRNQTKDFLIERLKRAFQAYGYEFLETPAIERQEILLGKMGDEAQKLLYLFEDNGQRKVGLRYDLTVPLSRFVAANLNTLALPYKRYEIGPVWRAERPQKGRYRQFWQADVDIIGIDEPAGEIELIELVDFVARELDLKLECRINDRNLINAIFKRAGIKNATKVLQTIDKRDKLSEEALDKELKELGLTDVQLRQINAIFLTDGDDSLGKVEQFLGDSQPLENVKTILEKTKDLKMEVVFYPSMVRGLDYYTGFIVECLIAGEGGSSVVGGGRYDDLIDKLVGTKIPAVGLSFGVDRLTDYLENRQQNQPNCQFVINLPETENLVRRWVDELRLAGGSVELFLDSSQGLGKQIKYADKKGYKKVLIPFENEWRAGQIIEKDLATGEQTKIPRDKIAK